VIVRIQVSDPRSVSMVSFLALAAATEEGEEPKHFLRRLSAFSHSWYSRLVHSLRSTASSHCCDARALSDPTRAASAGGAAAEHGVTVGRSGKAEHGVPATELIIFSFRELIIFSFHECRRDVGVGTELEVPTTGEWFFCASAGALKKALSSLGARACGVGGKLRGVLASLEIEREALAPAGALLRWVGLSERDSQRAISGLATWLGEQEVEGSGVLLSPWA
jgi:hypothetical protein